MNPIDGFLNRVPSESQRLYDQFVANLPNMIREAGLPSSALTPVLFAVAERFGEISASAGNALIHDVLMNTPLPTKPSESGNED